MKKFDFCGQTSQKKTNPVGRCTVAPLEKPAFRNGRPFVTSFLRRPLKLQNVTLHPVIPAIDLEAGDAGDGDLDQGEDSVK